MLFRAVTALLSVLGLMSFCLNSSPAQEQVGGATPAPIVQAGSALKDPSSYALGFNVGSNFVNGHVSDKELDGKDFLVGLMDAISKRDPKLTHQQMDAAFQAFDKRMQNKMLEVAKSNMERANAYLEANKKKDGVQTLKSGLQYLVLKTGSGKTPTINDTFVAHYEGKLVDGTIFDSSIKRNEPLTRAVSGVVKGWTEALQRMKVGDKWLLTLPPALAYGEQGQGPIGPNEALIFELELLDVIKGQEAKR
ncbi:MAG: FKBP-type peptidyl-prolyl cis-trans isomerase [Pirellula sp.]